MFKDKVLNERDIREERKKLILNSKTVKSSTDQ